MTALSRAAGLAAFALCPTPGCDVRVYAPLHIPTRCKGHGGSGEMPEYREPDPFGNPRANTAGPSPAVLRPSLEVL